MERIEMKIVCRHCANEYVYSGYNPIASLCPKCGKSQRQPLKEDLKWLLVLLVPCVLIAWLFSTCSGSSEKNSEFNATAYARGYALSQLRDSSSGKTTIASVRQTGEQWEIYGTLSGANMLGGRTVHSWRAVLSYDKDYPENYRMESFVLDDPY